MTHAELRFQRNSHLDRCCFLIQLLARITVFWFAWVQSIDRVLCDTHTTLNRRVSILRRLLPRRLIHSVVMNGVWKPVYVFQASLKPTVFDSNKVALTTERSEGNRHSQFAATSEKVRKLVHLHLLTCCSSVAQQQHRKAVSTEAISFGAKTKLRLGNAKTSRAITSGCKQPSSATNT